MARQLRKKSGTGIYHVMVRGINRQDIFEDEEDYLQMVSILRALSDRHDEQGLRLPPLSIFYAYCLMSNLFLKEKKDFGQKVIPQGLRILNSSELLKRTLTINNLTIGI